MVCLKALLYDKLGLTNADIVTRVLYRLQFLSEQRPFDGISLTYILPLVMAVLRDNGIGRTESDEVDEQITLALEILAHHTELCEQGFDKQYIRRS